jgi:hypothetical protein
VLGTTCVMLHTTRQCVGTEECYVHIYGYSICGAGAESRKGAGWDVRGYECDTGPFVLVETMTSVPWGSGVRLEWEKEVHHARGHRYRRVRGTYAKSRSK